MASILARPCSAFPRWPRASGVPHSRRLHAGRRQSWPSTVPAREVMGGGAEILPLDRAAWTATLDDLLGDADRRRDLAAHGREVAARYRWDRTCDQVLEACGRVGRTHVPGGSRLMRGAATPEVSSSAPRSLRTVWIWR